MVLAFPIPTPAHCLYRWPCKNYHSSATRDRKVCSHPLTSRKVAPSSAVWLKILQSLRLSGTWHLNLRQLPPANWQGMSLKGQQILLKVLKGKTKLRNYTEQDKEHKWTELEKVWVLSHSLYAMEAAYLASGESSRATRWKTKFRKKQSKNGG